MAQVTGKPPKRSHVAHLALLFAGALVFSAVSLKFLPRPFVWAGLVWTGVLIMAMFRLHTPWRRALLFNLAFVLIILTAAEAYLDFLVHGPTEYDLAASTVTYPSDWVVQDDVVGFAPKKDMQVRTTKLEWGAPLYNVTYTIDSTGLRSTPAAVAEPSACVLFFGDSFTFGEGLQDTETLPYQVWTRSGGKCRAFNFGFGGYGPHQMLSQIESGMVKRLVGCRPDYVMYTAIPDHVARVAGKIPYGNHAPRYQLGLDDEVKLAGHFEKASNTPVAKLLKRFNKSGIFKVASHRQPTISQDDVRLFFAIVKRSRELAERQFPGAQFHIILWESWNEEQELYRILRDGFRRMGIPTHLAPEMLPGYILGPSKYVLSRSDRHPSASANGVLADYVWARIVEPGVFRRSTSRR